MKHLKLGLIFGLFLLVGCSSEVHENVEFVSNPELKNVPVEFETYQNTFLEDRLEGQWGNNYGLGDPYIYRFNGVYYLICSTQYGQKGVKGWKSVDLMNWEPVDNGVNKRGYIVSDSIDESFDAWASEVYYLDGTFYLVESRNGKGHYVMKSDSPEGPFEVLTDQMIDNNIDGSMYMDIDGRMVLLTADSYMAAAYFADDMKSVGDKELLRNVTMSGWTEGPELITVNGIRYYFFTGNGVTQKAYRMDYCFNSADKSITDQNSIQQGKNVLLNTEDDWYGLGHGCLIMGPDLDSYYMGYHNSFSEGNNTGRRFNLSRLLFNGTDVMMQHTGLYDNIVPSLADYVEADFTRLTKSEELLLSSDATKDSFTIEFNVAGSGKMIFSYQDHKNYGYIDFNGNTLSIHKVSDGQDEVKANVPTYRSFNTEVLHAIRIGYKDGLMDVSFDSQEIANDVEVGEFRGGKVGYTDSYAIKGCLTFNNTAQGDSDKKTAKQENIPATSYDLALSHLTENSGIVAVENTIPQDVLDGSFEMKLANKGDYATYLEYVTETGSYGLDMVTSYADYGKTIGIQIDGGDIMKWTIPDYSNQLYKGYFKDKVADLYLEKGNHYITLISLEDEFSFQMLYCEKNYSTSGTEYVHDLKSYPDKGIQYPTFMNSTEDGLVTTNTARYLCTFGNGTLEDVEMSCDIKITGDNGTGTLGIVLACDDWALNNVDLDNYKSIRGYYCALNTNKITIIKSNYQYSDETCRDIYQFKTGETYNIKAIKQGKVITMYVNGTKVLETFDPMGRTRGYCGLYSNHMEVTFSNLKIKTL